MPRPRPGEPSGLHFQVQVKGRSLHKRKAKKLAEPLKTKHLRYYLRCEEPVFVFLIDPVSKRGNWLFIQRYLVGANPLFPRADALEEIESDDVRLMVELLECGHHEQENAGQTIVMSAEVRPDSSPKLNQAGKISLREPIRLLNFCGMQVPLGPLIHTWTDVRLVAVNPLDNGRTELTWEGGAKSLDRLDYERTEDKTVRATG